MAFRQKSWQLAPLVSYQFCDGLHIFPATQAMIFSGAIPKYIIPEYNSRSDIPDGVTSSQVEKAIVELEQVGKKAAAVLIISSTFQGTCSNIGEIT